MKPQPIDKTLTEEAYAIVSGARQENYDHPLHNFKRIAQIWSVILDKEVTEEQVGLCMVGLKLAREVFKHNRDNFVDLIGYALTTDAVVRSKSETP